MIAIFDEDGGGDVDFQEFVSGLSAFSSKGNKEEKLRFAFRVYDIDRDGYISNGELFIVLKMMVGSNLKDQQLQQVGFLTKALNRARLTKPIDCRQDHYGGRPGPRWQDKLRGVHENGGEHGRVYEHDPGPVLVFSFFGMHGLLAWSSGVSVWERSDILISINTGIRLQKYTQLQSKGGGNAVVGLHGAIA
jgi:hypothetical protein